MKYLKFNQMVVVNGLIYALIQFVQTIFVAKFYGPNFLSTYGLVLGIFAPLFVFLNSSQRFNILSEDTVADDFLAAHIKLRIFSSFIFFLLSAILLLLFKIDFKYGVLILSVKSIEFIFDILQIINQKTAKSDSYVWLIYIRLIACTLPIALSVVFHLKFPEYLFYSFVIIFLLALLYFIVNNSHTKYSFTRLKFIYLLPSLFFSGISAGLDSAFAVFPRFLLKNSGNNFDIAFFVVFTQLTAAAGILASSKLQADIGYFKLVKNAEAMRKLISMQFLLLAATSICATIFVILFFDSFFVYVFGFWIVEYKSLIAFFPLVVFFSHGSSYVANILAAKINSSIFVYHAVFSFVIFSFVCFPVYFYSKLDVYYILFAFVFSGLARFLIFYYLVIKCYQKNIII